VAIACEPTRVEADYGHVRKGEVLAEHEGVPVYQVAEFTEKPETRVAQRYTESGDYLWNANFFVWASETLMKQFEEFEPQMHESFVRLREAAEGADFRDAVRQVYPSIKKTAIDYAVLEPAARAGRMAVIPVAMEWSDIGSWATLCVFLLSTQTLRPWAPLVPASGETARDLLIRTGTNRAECNSLAAPEALLPSSLSGCTRVCKSLWR